MTTFILSVSVALVVSALCSLMESVLLSLTPAQLADISKKSPSIGKIWQRFKSNIERPISVILTLNTTAHTIGAAVAGASFSEIVGVQWLWVFSLLFTFAMLQYTEILPKTVGVRFNQKIAYWMARPLDWMIFVFSPIITLIRLINRPFEPRTKGPQKPATLDELTFVAALARSMHEIDSGQEKIIVGATRLSKKTVAQVMIPIDDVAMISSALSIAEAVVVAHIDAHTRFPVYQGDDRSQVIGYVNFKEIIGYLRLNPHAQDLVGVIRPIPFCKTTDSVPELLSEFTGKHEHIAIVCNESDSVVGFVTLEDIVEELVGELEDEFDRLPRSIHRLEGDIWLIGGGVPVGQVFQRLDADDSHIDNPQQSIAAWLEPQIERAKLAVLTDRKDESAQHSHFSSGDTTAEGEPDLTVANGPTPCELKALDELECRGLHFQIRRVRRKRIFEVAVSRRSRLEEKQSDHTDQASESALSRIYAAPGTIQDSLGDQNISIDDSRIL
ncbi:MAG: hemolysin family protein [Thermoguttaceae bacterium]|nr:hemolysin family protein [Thermoguttaceae bacterium]